MTHTLSPIQERLLEMLAEVVQICDENGLVYYAAGGTTLGAMRHKGFIPWDDDVDIMMPRQDWLRFVEIARSGQLPENRKLCCLELDEDYPHVFGRYADTTTCAIHYNQFLGGTAEGMVIDIFILDPVPDAGHSYQAHREALSLFNDVANSFGYSYPMSSSTKNLNHYARRVRTEGRRSVLAELEREVAKYDEGEYLVMRWAAAPRLFHKSIFGFPRFEPFEDLNISVPAKCNDYLVYHYGDDWMQLPTHSGRLTHDAITFTDVNYQTVLNDYLPFLDVERTKRAILKRRNYHVQHMAELHRAEDLRAKIVAAFTRESTLNLVATCGYDLDKALVEGRHDLLDEVFGDYYRHQCSPLLEGREEYLTIRRYHDPILIDIGERFMRLALLNLVDTNRIARAARILRTYRLVKGQLTEELEDVERHIDAARLPRALDDLGCKDEAYALSEYVLETFPENYSNRVFFLSKLDEREDGDRKRSIADEGLRRFPLSGEFLKESIDCEVAQAATPGQLEESYKRYASALERTTDAFVAEDALTRASSDPRISAHEDILQLLQAASASACQEIPQKTRSLNAKRAGTRALQLLCELDRLCAQSGIEHYAGPLSCLVASVCADGADCPLPPELDLLVPANQMNRLATVMEGQHNPNRTTDSWLTNGNYPSFHLSYVDTSTAFLQLDEGTDIAAPGIRVVVMPIRTDLGKSGNRVLPAVEEGWELNGYKLTKGINAKKALRAGAARIAMVQGRRRAASALFQKLGSTYDASSQKCWLHLPGKKPVSFSRSQLEGENRISLAGSALPAPVDVNGFLAQVFGASWASDAMRLLAQYDGALATTAIPYAELQELLKSEGCACDELYSLMRRIRIGMLPLANDLRIRNHAMRIAERTRDRKTLYDSLHVQNADIQAALKADDFETLELLFADYEKAALSYLRHGLGLCPSKEHLDILCQILRRTGRESQAQSLERLAPEAHYKPLI